MHARADTDLLTHGWYLTLSVIDTGLDLENHCHSSLRRSNSHIISHKGKRDGGNKKRDRGGEHEGGRGEGGGAVSSVKCFFFFVLFSIKEDSPPKKPIHHSAPLNCFLDTSERYPGSKKTSLNAGIKPHLHLLKTSNLFLNTVRVDKERRKKSQNVNTYTMHCSQNASR